MRQLVVERLFEFEIVQALCRLLSKGRDIHTSQELVRLPAKEWRSGWAKHGSFGPFQASSG